MLLSLALIFLIGMMLGEISEKMNIPRLVGMVLTGVLLGPYVLNLLDPAVLNISIELRQIALIIILMRAGLNLDIKDLKKVGRPALLMCFIPACFEIAGAVLLGPILLGLSVLDAVILGTVIAAVSPAIVIPRMLKLMEEGYGEDKSIPQMIMAGASVDDVFVIVLFTAFIGLAQSGVITPIHFLTIPTSIIFGLVGGGIVGLIVAWIFTKIQIHATGKIMIILSVSFLLVVLEQSMSGVVGFAGLLAVMSLGVSIQIKKHELVAQLSGKLEKLWIGAEIILFVLVGASVNIHYALNAGMSAFLLIIVVLLFRMLGVFASLIKTNLNKKEKVFTAFSYIPKATVQAAIGGLPLAMGLASGEIILTVAVISIIITAPMGAALIDVTHKKLLKNDKNKEV